MNIQSRSARKAGGFSLVELVVAMAIATIAMMSALGMISVAMDAEKDSGRDTMVVPMVQQVLAQYRALPFDALWAEEPEKARDAALAIGMPAESRYYFTMEGVAIPAAQVQGNFDAHYECVVVKTPDPLTQTPARTSGGAGTPARYNQLKLQLQFRWPVNARTGNPQNQMSIYASISRY